MTREENMEATDDQYLTVHTSNNFKKKENFHHNKKQKNTKRDTSNVRCYTCDEKGNVSRDFPIRKRRHHAHVSKYDEPTKNLIPKREG